MSKFFIHRPIFAIVIALIIVISGLLAALQLPIAQYPQISPPTVTVSTTYVGANAKAVNEAIAQVIEQQVNGTQGMDYMSSNSNDSGYYSMSVVFELGTDGDMDASAVYSKDEGEPEEYKIGGDTHYIMTNCGKYFTVWRNGTLECGIAGVDSRDELIKIIDSIYK